MQVDAIWATAARLRARTARWKRECKSAEFIGRVYFVFLKTDRGTLKLPGGGSGADRRGAGERLHVTGV